MLLAATIGPPYFLLASTGPLLQSWLARHWPARSVYRLFALSNAGSLAGLLLFPLLIEPRYGSRAQALGWSAAYAVFALACSSAAWLAWRTTVVPTPGEPNGSFSREAGEGQDEGLGEEPGVRVAVGARAPLAWLGPARRAPESR